MISGGGGGGLVMYVVLLLHCKAGTIQLLKNVFIECSVIVGWAEVGWLLQWLLLMLWNDNI